jgi:hypothetical protein
MRGERHEAARRIREEERLACHTVAVCAGAGAGTDKARERASR